MKETDLWVRPRRGIEKQKEKRPKGGGRERPKSFKSILNPCWINWFDWRCWKTNPREHEAPRWIDWIGDGFQEFCPAKDTRRKKRGRFILVSWCPLDWFPSAIPTFSFFFFDSLHPVYRLPLSIKERPRPLESSQRKVVASTTNKQTTSHCLYCSIITIPRLMI